MKVLIIDDEEDIRSIAAMSLGILGGMEVVEAESGEDGIAKAAETQPDAILLDMMMPVLDGPGTLVKLKENPQTKEIPVIFLTARSMNAELEKLKSMGATGFLAKPFDPTALSSQIKRIIGAE
ncbi:MAG: response regulator [Candidatus Obscuribacterales bacterium]|nr:response regulator [Candidatus Obscuribacterales bacterium]